MSLKLQDFLKKELLNLQSAGLFQEGYTTAEAQEGKFKIGAREIINMVSQNYLGWANDTRLKLSAVSMTHDLGVGWAASPATTGGHVLHKKLQKDLASFMNVEDCLLYHTAYQAHVGLFESLFSEQDYLFCDFSLSPSMVDGVRLSSAKQFIFKSQDLDDLEDKLKRSPNARFRAIVLESVSLQTGKLAPLDGILKLAEKFDALIILEDSQGIGVLGAKGRGLAEQYDVLGRIYLTVGTFGGPLGGGAGAFVCGSAAAISWLRQKSRSYLFSETLSPASLGAALKAVEILQVGATEIHELREKTELFRKKLRQGFDVVESIHPCVGVITKDAVKTQTMVNKLFQAGVYVLGFCYPVVPKGAALIRAQVSAVHTKKALSDAADAFLELVRA